MTNGNGFDEGALYDAFPAGAEYGYGPDEGFNVFTRLNNPDLFTEEAREDPVIQAFLNAPSPRAARTVSVALSSAIRSFP